MSLDDIPGSSPCVIGTNVLLYGEHGCPAQHSVCSDAVPRVSWIGALRQTVWQELTRRLMLAEAMMKREPGRAAVRPRVRLIGRTSEEVAP